MRFISRYVAGGGHTIDAECSQCPRATPQDQLGAVCDDGVREVPPIVRCKSDNRHHAPGLDQIGEPGERFLGGHVMEGGDRHHCVERTRLERNVKQIALLPFDRDPRVACPRPLEDLPVHVEPDDVRNAAANQMRRQDAVTTTHVENATRSLRDRLDEERMVMDIRIPKLRGSIGGPSALPFSARCYGNGDRHACEPVERANLRRPVDLDRRQPDDVERGHIAKPFQNRLVGGSQVP